MSSQIPVSFVQQFKNNLVMLSQQKGSKLRNTVEVENVVGKYSHVDRIGAVAAQLRLSRHADTPQLDTPHSRRRLELKDYEWADLIDVQDKVRMLIDPTSDYSKSAMYAMGRAIDDNIISALFGNSVSVDSSDASSNVSLPSSQIIDEDFVTSNSDLTLEKLIRARKILLDSDVDLDSDPAFAVIDPTSLEALLKETEVTSSDYNTVKALANGQLDTFMGFKFIVSNRIPKTSEGFARALFYTKSAVKLGIGEDVVTEIDRRSDKGYATQVYARMSIGAVRVEEAKVVVAECYRA